MKYLKYKSKYIELRDIYSKSKILQVGGRSKINKNIIYFHYPCNDGLASAWVARLKLEDVELRPYNHGNKIDLTIKDKIIYFLDMAPSLDVYKTLTKNNDVYVLDHHKSNQVDYENLKDKNIHFDMEYSGVGLAWNFFFPKKEMPLFLQMIQGRDLFKFEIDNINEFIEVLNLEMHSIKDLNKQLKMFDDLYTMKNKLDEFIDLGIPLVRQKELKVKALGDKYINNIYIYEGHKLCMVNVDSDLTSDLGHYLTTKPQCDFAILWYYDHISEKYHVSMRSFNKVDVSVICKKFGGGGHPNASACRIDKHPIYIFGKKKLK
jgi:oligoribonuclease NrnB/cAMP/cGMP phosphodiesterase (DHH superfamily)